ncbi:transglycosylase SLT domain-containing protein [Cellulomonas algicola]|uniref:aggregation-promoting factor C-terminal-like domain-containing protein n=2 Tax=Cellulomonas algicola TaxID=2071633 RepID=UPI001C3F7D2F|nr:transglycosylase SLT domain-containing protein [Cellulomonas algicola]
MTASPKRHRHRAEPAPRRLPAWCRSRAVAPLVSVGIVTVAVLTSASASSRGPAVGAEPMHDVLSATRLSPVADAVTAPADASWTAPDAEAAWLAPAIRAEVDRIAAEKAEAERLAAEAAAAAAAQAEHEAAAAKAARDKAARRGSAGSTPVLPSRTPVGEVKQYAASLVGADQFGCLEALWQRESGWNPAAKNRSSGAFGIPQALPATKMASAGADWQTNPMTQVRWGVSYIHGRYGSPCGAWAHSESHGWY